jgi:hypothetical protein
MTSARTSVWIKLSHQLISLSGPFEGLESLHTWRFVDFLISHRNRSEVMDAVDETLLLWIEGQDKKYVPDGGPAMSKLHWELRDEFNQRSIAESGISWTKTVPHAVIFDQTVSMKIVLKAHDEMLSEYKRKSRVESLDCIRQEDEDSDRYFLRFGTLRMVPGELSTHIHIHEFPRQVWSLGNFCGVPYPFGVQQVFRPDLRNEVVRKTILYAKAVFDAFRPILDVN